MPRGGARVGSGPKPRKAQPLTWMTGGRTGESLETPPPDLPADQVEFWGQYAKPAIEARTLTPQTVGAFRLLCELDAEKRATKATIAQDGRTFVKCTIDGSGAEHQELKAHPLTASYRQLAQRVESLMGRFGLAPFGKPVADAKPPRTAANPWARIVARK